MLQAVSYFWYGQPQEPIVINGKRNHVVESYEKITTDIPQYFEKASADQLLHLKRIVTRHQLEDSHPFHKKINDAIAKTAQAALKTAKANSEKRHTSQGLVTTPSSSTVFVQNCMTIKDVKVAIQENGSQWQEVVLNNCDDEMLSMIVSNCPNLTSLKIILREDTSLWVDFTDAGLLTISTLPNLQKLELSIWAADNLSGAGLTTMLQQPQLQKNLKELSITSFLLGDVALSTIGQFQALTSLSCATCGFTSAGFLTFSQSTLVKNTLQSLTVTQGATWNDVTSAASLYALSSASQLARLNLNCGWQITDQNLLGFLQAKPNMVSLGISGYPISTAVFSQIGGMSKLSTLTLGDCSQLGDFSGLVKTQSNLTSLSLGNATYFKDADLAVVATYPNLTSLTLLNASWLYTGLKDFCNAPNMVKQLTSLYLSGNNEISPHQLSQIGQLGSLTTLKMENMSYFNDDVLHAITEGTPLTKSLQALQLTGVSISDRLIGRLGEFTRLNTLMMTNCYALTKRGMSKLVNSTPLQDRLTKLYLAGEIFDADLILGFNNFHILQNLYLGNLINVDINSKAYKQFRHLTVLRKNNTEICTYWGELISFQNFVDGTF